MAKNEHSSKKLAHLASRTLRSPTTSKSAKRLAGSVLTQSPDRKKRKR
jgi:hypothetical protein